MINVNFTKKSGILRSAVNTKLKVILTDGLLLIEASRAGIEKFRSVWDAAELASPQINDEAPLAGIKAVAVLDVHGSADVSAPAAAKIRNFSVCDLTGILDRAEWEATAWPLPWVAGRPDPGS